MVKNWILKTFFSEELKEATRQGSMDAFKKAHADLMETRADDIEKRAEELAKIRMSELLSPVDWNSVVSKEKIGNGFILYVGGVKVEENRLNNFKQEVEAFEQFDLYKILFETSKELAQKSMFVNGESLADMQKGRSMLYTLSSMRTIMDLFKAYVKK